MNLSAIRHSSLFGRALRLPLRLVPRGMVVRVVQGQARGMRWVVGASTHGCWLGSYEAAKQDVVARLLGRGDTFWDVGANVGFYTLLAARAVGPSGGVVAVEPLPENLTFLRRHVALNGLERRVTVVEGALGDCDGTARLTTGGDRSEGRLDGDGQLEVRLARLDSLVDGGFPAPNVMKLDVEGAEAAVLAGAARTIVASRPTVLVATHGEAVHRECVEWLRARGYAVTALDGDDAMRSDELIARPS